MTYNKALGFRLSDMDVSEYLLPGYVYTGAQRKYTLPVQNKMKIDEDIRIRFVSRPGRPDARALVVGGACRGLGAGYGGAARGAASFPEWRPASGEHSTIVGGVCTITERCGSAHLGLRDQDGNTHRNVFLQQELWSPDRKILTVLFDPGRVKTGTMRHVDMGAPLAGYTGVELTLDGVGVKRWRADRIRCGPLNTSSWEIEAPQANGRSALRVLLPEAIDRPAEQLLAVVDASGRRVAGA